MVTHICPTVLKHLALVLALFVCAWATAGITARAANAAEDKVALLKLGADGISIGTGGEAGLYYQAGKTICHALAEKGQLPGLKCTPVNTTGAASNIEKLRRGELNFAIVPSDVQFYAANGYGPFKSQGAFPKLRSVLSIHPELFTVVVRSDANIRSFDDLKGKRVNIGNLGSGQRAIMDLLMHVKKWTKDDFALTMELPSAEHFSALCLNKVDAIVSTVGHPNSAIHKNMHACKTRLISVQGDAIDRMVKTYPFFSSGTIAAVHYDGTSSLKHTFGVTATLVTSSDTPNTIVHELLRTFFIEIGDLKRSHLAFKNLSYRDMKEKGLYAPLHPAAQQYFSGSK